MNEMNFNTEQNVENSELNYQQTEVQTKKPLPKWVKILPIIIAIAVAVTVKTLLTTGVKRYDTVDALLSSSEAKDLRSTLNKLNENLESAGMTCNWKGDGDNLILEYKYNNTYDDSFFEGAKVGLETSIDNQAATYVKLAKELSKKVKSENPAVILRYLKGDGSIIVERKFYKDTHVDEEKTAPERTTNLSGKIYSSIEDYLNDPTVQASFEQVKNQTDTSEYSVDVKAEQDNLIYIYTLKIEVQSDEQELMAQYIENNLASAEPTFKNIANTLKAVVDVQNPCVVLRYEDNKGTFIFEKEFYAD